MSRRAKPENIYIAGRMANLEVLRRKGVSDYTAELWVSAWEAEGRVRGLDRLSYGFWDDGRVWIAEQGAVRREPPDLRRGG